MTKSVDKLDQLLVTGGGLFPEPVGPPEDWSGRTLGAFELQEQIGVGGMATVYRARRIDRQFEQQVAVKVLSEEFAGAGHQQRFLRERQILADLDHPNIARIIDGGVEQSRPYLVMDLIDGVPLDQFCKLQASDPHQRLALFTQICRAVRHAHSKGVVHQDLKPANVLINHDGQLRLLDFGIAAVHGAAEEAAARLFTPRYAAPEQFVGDPGSTATDVFQLGLLLYNLFGASYAFGPADASLVELRERVLNDEPLPLPEGITLPEGWRQDLNIIIAGCLKKAPQDRYADVDHLIADLRALSDNRPLPSQAHRTLYRLNKFSARHRMTLGVLLVTVLAVGLGGMALWRQVQEQRAKAAASARDSAALGELVTDMLQSVDPLTGGGTELGEVISSSSFELSTATRDQPQLQREVVLRSSRTMLDLGHYADVIRMVEPLVEELARLRSPPPRYAEYLSLLGYAHYRNGKLERGMKELELALTYQRDRIGTPPDALAQTLQRLALAQRRAALLKQAQDNIQGALDLLPAAQPQWAVQRAQALSQRGLILTDAGQLPAAVASFDEALAGFAALTGDFSLRRAMTLSNLADAQRLLGQLDAARRNAEQSVALLAPLYDENPRLLATAQITLGNVAMAAADHDAAATEYQAALATYERVLGADHPRVALVAHNLATALRLAGNCADARGYYDRSIAIASASYPPDHPELVETRRQRALCPPDL